MDYFNPCNVTFDSTVCGGFPVEVRAGISPPEPDVGLCGYWVSDMEIFTRRGKPANFLKISEADDDRLVSEALEHFADTGE